MRHITFPVVSIHWSMSQENATVWVPSYRVHLLRLLFLRALVLRKGVILLIGVQLPMIQSMLLIWHSYIILSQSPEKVAKC